MSHDVLSLGGGGLSDSQAVEYGVGAMVERMDKGTKWQTKLASYIFLPLTVSVSTCSRSGPE